MIDLLDLTMRYNEPHRHYHNLSHIGNMFYWASRAGQVLTIAQTLAIWYHDAVYVPGSPDNEVRSADILHNLGNYYQVLGKSARLGVDDEELRLAQHIILDTKTHIPTNEHSDLVIDLDLAGLGSAWEAYYINRKHIRREYSAVEYADFRAGRNEFLKTYLARKNLFYTPWFIRNVEPLARRNMEHEIFMNSLCNSEE